jgi:hypothetical protein
LLGFTSPLNLQFINCSNQKINGFSSNYEINKQPNNNILSFNPLSVFSPFNPNIQNSFTTYVNNIEKTNRIEENLISNNINYINNYDSEKNKQRTALLNIDSINRCDSNKIFAESVFSFFQSPTNDIKTPHNKYSIENNNNEHYKENNYSNQTTQNMSKISKMKSPTFSSSSNMMNFYNSPKSTVSEA